MGKSDFSKQEESEYGKCKAYGCPLSGDVTNSLGAGTRYCIFHLNAQLSDFDNLTTRIKKALPLLSHSHRVKNCPVQEYEHFMTYRDSRGNEKPELSMQEGENKFTYSARLYSEAKKYILEGV